MARRTEIIAHRGVGFDGRENTLSAVRAVAGDERFGLEIDVHLTADGDLVVHHDPYLDPSWTRAAPSLAVVDLPPLSSMGAATLAQVRIAGRADDPESWEPMLHLAEVLALWTPTRPLLVEMKGAPGADPRALAEATARRVVQHDRRDQVVLMGFDWDGLALARRIDPTLRTFHLSRPSGSNSGTADNSAQLDRIAAAGGSGWAPHHRDLTPQAATRARALGLQLAAWTVNAPDEMARLIALGVDCLITDDPLTALAIRDAA